MAEEANVQGTVETTAKEPVEKTFTQAEIDDLIKKRLNRERSKYPTEDEMSAFHAWQESRQTQEERLTALTGERDTARTQLAAAQTELEQLKREKYLAAKGVPADDLDYYAFKIGKLVTDGKTFEQAADDFLQKHQQSGTETATNKNVTVSFGAPLGTSTKSITMSEFINAKLRGK